MSDITQDQKIQKLIDTVQQKKKEIGRIESQTYKTNCQFSENSDGKNLTNIQVVNSVEQLLHMWAFLDSRKTSWDKIQKTLGLSLEFKWQGYSYEDWVNDFQNKVNKVSLSAKRRELELLEGRLEKLVSPELRAKIELELIEKELGL
jgi:hypothetical protein